MANDPTPYRKALAHLRAWHFSRVQAMPHDPDDVISDVSYPRIDIELFDVMDVEPDYSVPAGAIHFGGLVKTFLADQSTDTDASSDVARTRYLHSAIAARVLRLRDEDDTMHPSGLNRGTRFFMHLVHALRTVPTVELGVTPDPRDHGMALPVHLHGTNDLHAIRPVLSADESDPVWGKLNLEEEQIAMKMTIAVMTAFASRGAESPRNDEGHVAMCPVCKSHVPIFTFAMAHAYGPDALLTDEGEGYLMTRQLQPKTCATCGLTFSPFNPRVEKGYTGIRRKRVDESATIGL